MRIPLMVALLAAVPLAGCLADEASVDAQSRRDTGGGEANSQADRIDGPVEVAYDAQRAAFVATQEVHLSGPVSGLLQLTLETVNGDVDTSGGSRSAYQVDVRLEATGDTEEQARRHLASMVLHDRHSESSGGTDLSAVVEFKPYEESGLPVQVRGHHRSAAIDAVSPATLRGLDASTTNGDVTVASVDAGRVDLEATNGDVEFDGEADSLDASTTNGDVDAAGTVGDITASNTNGDIDVALRPSKTGRWSFDSTNGKISVDVVTGDSIGYDIYAETTNGKATVEVAGAEPVGSQDDDEKHYRTSSYAEKRIQVRIAADTTNGDVAVTD